MTFDPYSPPIPDRAPRVTLILTSREIVDEDTGEVTGVTESANYEFTLVDADGRTIHHHQRAGDAIPHLLAAGIAQDALDLIIAARALVEDGVLPE